MKEERKPRYIEFQPFHPDFEEIRQPIPADVFSEPRLPVRSHRQIQLDGFNPEFPFEPIVINDDSFDAVKGDWAYDSDTTAWSFTSTESDSTISYSVAGLPATVTEDNINQLVNYNTALNELSLPTETDIDNVHVLGLESGTSVILPGFVGSNLSLGDTDNDTTNGYEIVATPVIWEPDENVIPDISNADSSHG